MCSGPWLAWRSSFVAESVESVRSCIASRASLRRSVSCAHSHLTRLQAHQRLTQTLPLRVVHLQRATMSMAATHTPVPFPLCAAGSRASHVACLCDAAAAVSDSDPQGLCAEENHGQISLVAYAG